MTTKRCKGCGKFIESKKSTCYDPECVLRQSEKVLGVKFKRIILNDQMVRIIPIREDEK